MNDVLVRKVTICASLKKINFPEIFEQAPLSIMKCSGHDENADSADIRWDFFISDLLSANDIIESPVVIIQAGSDVL